MPDQYGNYTIYCGDKSITFAEEQSPAFAPHMWSDILALREEVARLKAEGDNAVDRNVELMMDRVRDNERIRELESAITVAIQGIKSCVGRIEDPDTAEGNGDPLFDLGEIEGYLTAALGK